MVRTANATYRDGVLQLDEPIDLHRDSRVLVHIETPAPSPATTESLSADRRALFQRIQTLREERGCMTFNIVEELRAAREHRTAY